MLRPTTTTLRPSASPPTSSNGYSLSDVRLDIPEANIPENTCIRVESAPLATAQVVVIKLPR